MAQYATFLTNMQSNGPLARYGEVVWTSGNQPHEGGSDEAILLADTKANLVEVYRLSKGVFTHYADQGAAIPLEGDAKTVVANMKEAAGNK